MSRWWWYTRVSGGCQVSGACTFEFTCIGNLTVHPQLDGVTSFVFTCAPAELTGTGMSVSWTRLPTIQRPWTYTAADWGDEVKFSAEAWVKVTSGVTAYVRLYDETAAAAVAGSDASTAAADLTVVTGPAVTLTDGHDYRVQFGADGTGLVASTFGIWSVV